VFAHPERALLPTPLIRGVGAAHRPITAAASSRPALFIMKTSNDVRPIIHTAWRRTSEPKRGLWTMPRIDAAGESSIPGTRGRRRRRASPPTDAGHY